MNPNDISEQSIHPHRWPIAIAVMLATIIEVLDMTIVNVALPHMMGSLGANTQQITWVLTAYIVSAAICMPLTGFLTTRFGRRRLLLINITGFMIASALCGAATSLNEILIFRTLQGIFGASLVPLSQTIMQSIFSKKEQPKAMAIWGVGVMIAPVLGPTLGGYITDTMDWRWIFYINIPVCIATIYLTMRYLTETERTRVPIDWTGLSLMVLGIGALQLFLDQGNTLGWFQSNFIVFLAVTAVLALIIFAVRGLQVKNHIINLHLFKDRNFSLATIMLSAYCACMFGVLALVPLMLQELMNYPTATAGLVMMPQGLCSAVAMACAVKLLQHVDARRITLIGIICEVIGTTLMTQYTLMMGMHNIVIASCFMGFGMGLFFVPVTTLAYDRLAKKDLAEGAGLFSFGRNLGSSIGISILSTILTQQTQINWHRLVGYIRPDNPAFQNWLNVNHMSLNGPATPQVLAQTVQTQATMIGMLDCFWIVSIVFMLMFPMMFLFKKPLNTGKPMEAMH